jgi:hypothetical protein
MHKHPADRIHQLDEAIATAREIITATVDGIDKLLIDHDRSAAMTCLIRQICEDTPEHFGFEPTKEMMLAFQAVALPFVVLIFDEYDKRKTKVRRFDG